MKRSPVSFLKPFPLILLLCGTACTNRPIDAGSPSLTSVNALACSLSPSAGNLLTNQNILFTAVASGGSGTYTFSNATPGLSGSTVTPLAQQSGAAKGLVVFSYSAPGSPTASILVTDSSGNQTTCTGTNTVTMGTAASFSCQIASFVNATSISGSVEFTVSLSSSGTVSVPTGTGNYSASQNPPTTAFNTGVFSGSFGLAGAQTVSLNAKSGSGSIAPCTSNVVEVVAPSCAASSWNGNFFAAPAVSSISAADANHIYAIRTDNSLVSEWSLNSSSQWVNGTLAVTNPSANQPAAPALKAISAFEVSGIINVFGIRADTGHVNQWQWYSSNGNAQWINGNLAVTTSPSNTGPSISAISAMDANNVFGIRSDTGHVNQWWYDPSTSQWNNHDLTVTATPSNFGPSLSALATNESNGIFNIYAVRSDTKHVNQWQWTSSGGWTNGDLSPSNATTVPQYLAITVGDANNVFGIRADNNNQMNQWQWNNGNWSTYDFPAPALSSLKAVDANHIFAIRADTGAMMEWYYDATAQTWNDIEFCGQPLGSLAPVSATDIFGINLANGYLFQWLSN